MYVNRLGSSWDTSTIASASVYPKLSYWKFCPFLVQISIVSFLLTLARACQSNHHQHRVSSLPHSQCLPASTGSSAMPTSAFVAPEQVSVMHPQIISVSECTSPFRSTNSSCLLPKSLSSSWTACYRVASAAWYTLHTLSCNLAPD